MITTSVVVAAPSAEQAQVLQLYFSKLSSW
jgi:hypothetical protein